MYCPVCFQNNLKLRSTGVVKISFNGKSRNTSLFTYNLAKDSPNDLDKKMRERIADFMDWYNEFQNKAVLEKFEALSSDFQCTNNCKIDYVHTKISVVGLMFKFDQVKQMIEEEAQKRNLETKIKKA
jgi:hypothetical protein